MGKPWNKSQERAPGSSIPAQHSAKAQQDAIGPQIVSEIICTTFLSVYRSSRRPPIAAAELVDVVEFRPGCHAGPMKGYGFPRHRNGYGEWECLLRGEGPMCAKKSGPARFEDQTGPRDLGSDQPASMLGLGSRRHCLTLRSGTKSHSSLHFSQRIRTSGSRMPGALPCSSTTSPLQQGHS